MLFILLAAVLAAIGALVRFRKMTGLITGYNTLPEERQAEYDLEKLTRAFGIFLFALAGSFGLWGAAWLLFPQHADGIVWAGLIMAAGIILAGILWMNAGGRLKKK